MKALATMRKDMEDALTKATGNFLGFIGYAVGLFLTIGIPLLVMWHVVQNMTFDEFIISKTVFFLGMLVICLSVAVFGTFSVSEAIADWLCGLVDNHSKL